MSLMAQVERARSTLQAANEQLSEARGLLGKPKPEAPKEPEEKGLFDKLKDKVKDVSWSDVGHTVLDLAGLVPVLGAPADGINAVWYLAEGDKTNAALSAVGMLPIAGEAATAARLGLRATDAVRGADNAADAARAADACFVAGTKVLTTQGAKPIESLVIGDEVYAHDPVSGERASHRICQTFIRTVPIVLNIQIGETTITCSPEHPFWVPDIGWQKAGKLEPGDSLLTTANQVVRVDSIKRREGSFTVFNITVEVLNTYFVSNLGILVHNKPMRRNQTTADDQLEGGHKWRGDFPGNAGSNEVLYREGSDGLITHYQTYDQDGLPIQRVDLVGKPHGGVPTPHVVEFTQNTNPATGQVFVNKSSRVRPATPDEIPNIY